MKQDSARSEIGLGALLGAAAVGAMAMYFFDPDHGHRRRVWAQDKLQEVLQSTGMPGVENWARPSSALEAQAHGIPTQSPQMPGVAWLGGALAVLSLLRGRPLGALTTTALGLISRAGNAAPLHRLLQGTDNTQSITVQRSIDIKATPETVYDVWKNYENFPHFMSHVVEVRDVGRQRSHWIVKGPLGKQVEWDSVLTEAERGQALAWHSEPGAELDNNGRVTFEASGKGTRVTVRMSYTPPAGATGDSIAAMLGADPKQTLEEDLQRMKNFIERGVRQHDSGEPRNASNQLLH